MSGRVLRISRLRTGTDGKGITTLVALADCPLKCKYCINDFCHREGSYGYGVESAHYEAKELAELMQKDDIYFKMSDGGVTFGGGEPLLQASFIKDVSKYMDPAWNIRVETCLNAPWNSVRKLIGIVDEWIIDIKDMNSEIYKEYTGGSQEQMISNLKKLLKTVSSEKILIRVPLIPYYNTANDVASSVNKLTEMRVSRIEISF